MARSTLTAVALVAVLVLGAVACGSERAERAADAEPTGTASTPPGPTAPTATESGVGRIPRDALPGGWREVPWEQRLSDDPGTPTYCGVPVAPTPLSSSDVWYYEMVSLPSNVIEYVMTTTAEAATATMAALVQHRDSCSEPGRTVTPVDLDVGEESVAWDFTGSTSFRVIVFRRGATIVVLGATGITSVPVDEQLRIALAVDEALRS